VEGRPPEDEDPLVPPPDVEEEPGDDAGLRGTIADGVKKALLAGVGALFLTEEGARRLARDWKLPKDVAAFIGQQATSAKDELLRLFADEIRRFLENESVRREFWKELANSTVEIHAEIRLRPSSGDGPPRPEVTAEVRPRRAGKKAGK
jgi:hypothetical protein